MENKDNTEIIKIRRCDLHSVLMIMAMGDERCVNSVWDSIELMTKNVD